MTEKVILYQLCTPVNHGTQENPKWEDVLFPVKLGWNAVNEEIAKREAYNGEYYIGDIELEELEVAPNQEARIRELEEALELLLSGVTE